MSTATLAPAYVTSVVTRDGILVRLGGHLDADVIGQLRAVLLGQRPAGRDAVTIDAGDVSAMSDEALALLVAAYRWIISQGGRLGYSRVSRLLEREIVGLDLEAFFPLLEDPGARDPGARHRSAVWRH